MSVHTRCGRLRPRGGHRVIPAGRRSRPAGRFAQHSSAETRAHFPRPRRFRAAVAATRPGDRRRPGAARPGRARRSGCPVAVADEPARRMFPAQRLPPPATTAMQITPAQPHAHRSAGPIVPASGSSCGGVWRCRLLKIETPTVAGFFSPDAKFARFRGNLSRRRKRSAIEPTSAQARFRRASWHGMPPCPSIVRSRTVIRIRLSPSFAF